MEDNQQPIPYKDFAKRVKEKYPEYQQVDDLELSKRIVDKYPEYKDKVVFDDIKKKEEPLSQPSSQVAGENSNPASQSPSPSPLAPLKSLKGKPESELKDQSSKIGVPSDALFKAVNDFDGEDEFIVSKAKEFISNPAEYEKSKAAKTWRGILRSSMSDKYSKSIEDKNELNQFVSDEMKFVSGLQRLDTDPNTGAPIKENYDQSVKRVSTIRDYINNNVDDADKRAEALSALKSDAFAVVYEGMKKQSVVGKWVNDGKGDPFIGIGLDVLALTDKDKADSYRERLNNKVATEDDKSLVKKELEDIGISAVSFEASRNGARISKENPQSPALNNLSLWYTEAQKKKASQATRFKDLLNAEVDRALLDVSEGLETGTLGKSAFNLASGIVSGVKRGVEVGWNYLTKTRDERIADDMVADKIDYLTDSFINYTDAGSALTEQDFIPQLKSPELRKKFDQIMTDKNLSKGEKYEKLFPLMKDAYMNDGIDFISNPNKGNISLTAKNVFHLLSTSGARSIGNMVPSLISGGAIPMAIFAGVDAAAQKYGEKFREGSNNPLAAAVKTGAVVGVLSNVMDEADALVKAFKGVKPSLLTARPTIGSAVFQAGKTITSNVAKEEVEELATEVIDGDIVRNYKEVLIGTLLVSGPIAGITAAAQARSGTELYRQAWFEAGSDKKTALKGLEQLRDNSRISQSEYDAAVKRVDRAAEIVATMPVRNSKGELLNDSQKAKFVDNLLKKYDAQNMSKDMPGKIVEEAKAQAQAADEENAVILQGDADQGEVIAGDPVGQTDSKSGQPVREVVIANAQPEVDVIKGVAQDVETGATLNLDGTKYSGGGLVVPAASMNTTQDQLTPDMLADFIDQNKGKLADGESFKVGFYKFPGSNQVSIDLNIVVDPKNRDAAIEFGRQSGQESLFDLDTMENIKTGADGLNPKQYTDEEFVEIAKALKEGKVPFAKDLAAEIKSEVLGERPVAEVAAEAAQSVAKSLKASGIEVQILDSSKGDDVSAIGDNNQGAFIDTDGKIVIDQAKLSSAIEAGVVVWHEGAHPVMNIIRNTDKELYDSVVSGLMQAAESDSDIADVIEWAKENYEGDATSDDEAIVETIARIAGGVIDIDSLDTGFKQKLIDFINKIAKTLGLEPILENTDIQKFKETAARVAEALRTGEDIGNIVGDENIKEYMNNIQEPEIIAAGSFNPQARVSDKPIDVYQAKEVEKLPVRTLDDVYSQFGGKAVVINSDPTRVGNLKLPSGKEIFLYGGPGYLSLKENVDGNVGFATTQIGKVSSWSKYIDDLFGEGLGVTLVATQSPMSILSNSYSMRYVLDAISMLPKSVLKSSDFKNEFFGKDIALLQEAFGQTGYKEFVAKYKKADLSSQEVIDNMIAEMAYTIGDDNRPASFKARGAFVANLLGGIAQKSSVKKVEGDQGYVSKTPNKFIAKQLMDRLGINAEKVIREIGEPSLVDLYMNEGKWGMAVSGFETDGTALESVQSAGVKHPLFNAKFPGKNPFVLDGAYDVNEMFKPVEMTGPSGAPYIKKAAMMLAGSMYVKGDQTQGGGAFEYNPSQKAAGGVQASKSRKNLLSEDRRKKLTGDGNGNYVFFHYSGKKLNKIDPARFGTNLATGRDERPGVGISMFYTDNRTSEPGVPTEFGYAVRVPMDKVYPISEDPLNFYDKAKALFEKDYPGQAFDANKQVGYITKVANQNGFDMTIVDWNIKGRKALRAQTATAVKPELYKKKEFRDGIEREVYTPELEDLKPGLKGQASRGTRRFKAESNRNYKLAAYVMRKKAEGSSDAEIAMGIKGAIPGMDLNEIKKLIDNPEQFIRDKFSYLSKAVQENMISRARVQNVYAKANVNPDKAFSSLEAKAEDIDSVLSESKSEGIKETIRKFKNKYFDAAKGLPEWVLGIKDITGGMRDLKIRKATDIGKALKNTAKEIGFSDWEQFNKALRAFSENTQTGIQPWYVNIAVQNAVYAPIEPAEVSALPDEIKPFVYQMRGMIDDLTKELIGSGYVTPEQAINIEKNIGQYVNRAYKIFNEKGYKPSIEDKREAIKFLADNYIKQLADTSAGMLTYDEISKTAAEMAAKDVEAILSTDMNPYFKKTDSRETGILKERKDIPEPIRKLMGEYTDPVTAFVITTAKQASLVGASQYLTGLRNNGMGTIFFEKNDPNRPMEFSEEIASQGSDSMSPLNGLMTTKEIAEAIQSVEPTLSDLTGAWMKVVGAVRWGKTVGSVVTQVKNFLSNVGFAVMNGLVFTGENGKALSGAAKYWNGQMTNKDIDEVTEKVISLGLVNQSVGMTELRKMLGSGDVHDIAVELAVTGKAKTAKNWIMKPFEAANKFYQLSDDFWKVYAYMNERSMIAKAMFGGEYNSLSEQDKVDVDLEASERVKSTWPTYDRVWKGAKYLSERAPIFGNFISFQAESIRVLGNTFRLAMSDLNSGNPAFAAMGAKRMAGMISYMGIRSVATYTAAHAAGLGVAGLMGMFDDDDEKEKEAGVRNALPPFMRSADLLVIPQKDPEKFTVFDLSSLDPYGVMFKSMNALTEGREGIVGDAMQPGVAAALTEFFSGFLEKEMTFDVANDIMNNTNDKTGGKIFMEDDTKLEAILESAKYLLDKLKPSSVGFVSRLAGDNPAAELGAIAGARPYEIDLYKSFGMVISKNGKNFEDIIRAYNAVKYNKNSTPEEKKTAEAKAEKEMSYYAEKMSRIYKQFSMLGADPKKLDDIVASKRPVRVTGWSKPVKKAVRTGKIDSKMFLK